MINFLNYFLYKLPFRLIYQIVKHFNYFSFIKGTLDYQCPISLEDWFYHKITTTNPSRDAYWPVDKSSQVYDANKIYAGIDTCPGMSKGCYIQGKGGIYIGDYTQIAQNVIIVSANHDIYDLRNHTHAPVKIGKYCWLGAGSKIMPGVELGDFTVVAAGAVVTKSYTEGHCVLAGVPAESIKKLNKAKCVRYELPVKFYGYFTEEQFKNTQIYNDYH